MEIEDAVEQLGALAHASRLAIYKLLVRAGPEGLPVGALGDALDLPGATLTHHLDRLKAAGLVAARRDGRRIRVRARYERMEALLGYLVESCCQGVPEARAEGTVIEEDATP